MVADSTPPDVITFAGNGEPTMHPDFEAVIGDTIALRDALRKNPQATPSAMASTTRGKSPNLNFIKRYFGKIRN